MDFRKLCVGLLSLCSFAVSLCAIAATPLMGDFDGDGYTDVGLWDAPHVRALLDSTHDGRIDGITPRLGLSSDVPFMGDWDGDGVETLALYRRSSNQVIWTSSNKDGLYLVRSVAAISGPQALLIRGDWDGDGQDGFAIYDASTRILDFYQSMSSAKLSSLDAGNFGDVPLSGDWNNDGADGFGLYRPSTQEFWLYDVIGVTPARHIPSVGNPGDVPLAGKWPGRANWSVGLYRPSTAQFFLFNTFDVAAGVQLVTWLDPSAVIATNGRQSLYTDGVPHASVNGLSRTSYSPTDSFLLRGIFAIGDARNELSENIFQELDEAGYNVALLWPTLSITDALAESNGTNVRLVPRVGPTDVTNHDSNPRIFGWYMADEPRLHCYSLEDLQEEYATYQPISSRFLFHASEPLNGETPPCANPNEFYPPWSAYAALGDAGAVDDYPIHKPALLTTSIESIANSMLGLRSVMPATAPVWFVPQAFGNLSLANYFDMPAPSPDQYRAMVYTAFVHGASGLLTFGRDGWAMRNGDNLGISPHPVASYPNCQYPAGCPAATTEQLTLSKEVWSAAAHVNAELSELRPALLSPTSTATYTIDLLQTPNHGASPIRTLLKTSPNGTYLIAVNMINDNLDAVIQLSSAPAAVEVTFENRSIATPLGAIRDRFGPFAVHIYKF